VVINHQPKLSIADVNSDTLGDSPNGNRAELRDRAKILIVDDRDDKRLAMETIIAGLGENILQASSGNGALKCLLNHDFAVILLDVNMPGMDGFETAHLVRQRKNSEHTPIIFVTGISDTETHVSRGYSLGAVDYILTPVLPEVLRTKVAVFVELYKKTEQSRRQAERLRVAHDELEARVHDRTVQLASANESLQAEIIERRRVEEEIRKLNAELEQRVLDRTTELAEANQELEAFTYSVAHDLQAPLRNIQSYAQLLEEEFGSNVPPESMQYLRRIGTRVKHMAQLVSDLLNLSRIAKHELNRQETNLIKIVEEAISNAKAEAKDRDIEWHVQELTPVACDPGLIRQVFANLVSNAVKYTQPRPKARIEIGQINHNGEAPIYIRDNGVGFDMKFVDKLFGVFQRLHPAADFEGTGVGLATVARIIRKHGGSIWAESEEDKGATFYFTLGDKPKNNREPEAQAEG
jgi:two-component system sensor histidine kinase/response regulator